MQHPLAPSSRASRSRRLGRPALAALLAACADPSPRDLGFTQSSQDLNNIPDSPFYSDAGEFVGRWVGTAEEPLAPTGDSAIPTYQFPSSSTRIELEVARVDGGLLGHITFGSGEPPPPPEDPDSGYPVGVGYDQLLGYPNHNLDGLYLNPVYLATRATLPPFEGFAYTINLVGGGVSLEEDSLLVGDGVASFTFSSNEPLDPWCVLQTPYFHPLAGAYYCAPDTGGGYESISDGTGKMCTLYGPVDTSTCLPDYSNLDECVVGGQPDIQMNCDQLKMCLSGFCACLESGCFAKGTEERLSVRRVGDELLGLFEGATFKNARGLNVALGEVHLLREE